jgi:hypothetical protein
MNTKPSRRAAWQRRLLVAALLPILGTKRQPFILTKRLNKEAVTNKEAAFYLVTL